MPRETRAFLSGRKRPHEKSKEWVGLSNIQVVLRSRRITPPPRSPSPDIEKEEVESDEDYIDPHLSDDATSPNHSEAASATEESDGEANPEPGPEDSEDMVEFEEPKAKKVHKPRTARKPARRKTGEETTSVGTGLNTTLPPCPSVGVAFDLLVKNASSMTGDGFLNLKQVAKKGGFGFNLATMCSGTEAPVFALQMIQEAFFAQTGQELFRFEHKFSVEIEPFKQAYISRNTNATVFRDVCDFVYADRLKARTALGALMDIPENIHILIAGTSCVDFSKLNSNQTGNKSDFQAKCDKLVAWKKKNRFSFPPAEDVEALFDDIIPGLDVAGESEKTFMSVLIFIWIHRPRMVILENVHDAPWESVRDTWFPIVGYEAVLMSLDTKNYYLPQTRNRKYLVAVDLKGYPRAQQESFADVISEIQHVVKMLERRASSSVESFLIPGNSKQAQLARQELEAEAEIRRAGHIPWVRSKARHAKVRREEELGSTKPMTHWEVDGSARFYDRTDKIVMQPETLRVKDSLDIQYLRGTKREPSYDINFKTRIIDLSQNVDRHKLSSAFGISGCLTPKGMPWRSDDSRYVTGVETLLLQGIPPSVDISRETQDELRDLAGNAMSTTVVGAVLLGSFMACFGIDEFRKAPGKNRHLDFLSIQNSHLPGLYSVQHHTDNLEISSGHDSPIQDFDRTHHEAAAVSEIVSLVQKHRGYCCCSGTALYSSDELLICQVCGTIRCVNCAGNPIHNFVKFHGTFPAIPLETTEKEFMRYFPASIHGLWTTRCAPGLDRLFPDSTLTATILSAVFDYDQVLISNSVTLCYVADQGIHLRIHISEHDIKWNLCLDRYSHIGNLAITSSPDLDHRLFRNQPIASATLPVGVGSPIPQEDDWQIWDPHHCEGAKCACHKWNLRMRPVAHPEGIELFLDSGSASDADFMAKPILGSYTWKGDCDTAESSLFEHHKNKKVANHMFIFKDPSRTGDAANDYFVAATDCQRLEAHESREPLITFTPGQNIVKLMRAGNETKLEYKFHGDWVKLARGQKQHQELSLRSPHLSDMERVYIHSSWASSTAQGCENGNRELARMHCFIFDNKAAARIAQKQVHLRQGNSFIPLAHADLAEFFKATSSAAVKIASVFRNIEFEILQPARCYLCAPRVPDVHWMRDGETKQPRPCHTHEDMQAFDLAVKRQLPAFQVQTVFADKTEDISDMMLDVDKSALRLAPVSDKKFVFAHFRFVFNGPRLAHRALSYLPGAEENPGSVTLTARIETGHAEQLKLSLVPFKHSIVPLRPEDYPTLELNPKLFEKNGQKLQPEQRVSLTWLVSRENNPQPFVEQEVEEELVPGLQLRLVGTASRQVRRTGGIIADDVGYGKTVVSLALTATQAEHDKEGHSRRAQESYENGMIPLAATLIVVPSHIVTQWENEIKRFLYSNPKDKLVVIRKFMDLKTTTGKLESFKTAKIILVSEDVFQSESYSAKLGESVGAEFNGGTSGRAYRAWHDTVVSNIAKLFEARAQKVPTSELKMMISGLVKEADLFNQQLLDSRVAKSSRKKGKGKVKSEAGKDETQDSESDEPPIKRARKSATSARGKQKSEDDESEAEFTDDDSDDKPKRKPARGKAASAKQKKPPAKLFELEYCFFEYFSWARVIWDETSYASANQKAEQFATNVSADHKWLLSGTPPHQTMKDICSMARVLDVHLTRPIDFRLGLPRATQGPILGEGPILNQRTETEAFCSYGRQISGRFVAEVHDRGRAFLGTFSSSNQAFINEITVSEKLVVCGLQLFERLSYEQHQQAIRRADMIYDNLPPSEKRLLIHQDTDGGELTPTQQTCQLLISAASTPLLKNIGDQENDQPSATTALKAVRARVQEAERAVRFLSDKALWLAQRLMHCKSSSSKAAEIVEEYVDKLAQILGNHPESAYGGECGHRAVKEAVFNPSLEKDILSYFAEFQRGNGGRVEKTKLTNFGLDEDHMNLGTIKGHEILVGEKAFKGQAVFLNFLYWAQKPRWSDFFTINQVSKMGGKDEKINLILEYDYLKDTGNTSAPSRSELNKLSDNAINKKLSDIAREIQSKQDNELAEWRRSRPAKEKEMRKWCDVNCKKISRAEIVSKLRLFGMRYAAGKTNELLDKLRAHLDGVAELRDYSSFTPSAVSQRTPLPVLHATSKLRGATVAQTAEAFTNTFHTLQTAMDHLASLVRQEKSVEVFQDVQSGIKLECSDCGSKKDLYIVTECGHVFCRKHSLDRTICHEKDSRCLCRLEGQALALAKLQTSEDLHLKGLFTEEVYPDDLVILRNTESRRAAFRAASSKLKAILQVIEKIPKEDQVLIFAQHDHIIVELLEFLSQFGLEVKTTFRTQSAAQKQKLAPFTSDDPSATVEDFKRKQFRFLIQKMTSSEAAGANLPCANHIIFAAPLVQDNQHDWEALLKQAKGRCIRRGQQKTVHVYHFVTESTFEVDALELRMRKHIKVEKGMAVGGFEDIPATEEEKREADANDSTSERHRVQSSLSAAETWKAMGEVDYMTKMGLYTGNPN